MKLYTNNKGQWVGTLAEAKKIGAEAVDVPTDKPSLLAWLNAQSAPQGQTETPVYESKLTRPHTWQNVVEMAENAPVRDLGHALAVAMNRMADIADKYEH